MEPLLETTHKPMPKPTALSGLVSETVAANDASEYLAGVVADPMLRQYEAFYDDIPAHRHILQVALIQVITTKNHHLAEAIIARAKSLSNDDDRVGILGPALTAAVHAEDQRLTVMILDGGDYPLHMLARPFYSACEQGNVQFVNLLLPRLLGPLVLDEKALAREYGVGSNDYDLELSMRLRRQSVLARGLQLAMSHHAHSLCAVLLEPYISLLDVNIYTEDAQGYAFLAHLHPEAFERFSRERCFELLCSRLLLTVLRCGFLSHLRVSAPPDMLLTAEGHTYETHKDILGYFSEYFRALFPGMWVDKDHVDLSDGMSVKTLKALQYYMRIGEYDHKTMVKHDIPVEDIWIAADYLWIDCLARRLKQILDMRRERERNAYESCDEGEPLDDDELKKLYW
ncbi:hypothetical protein BJX62DRAFT_238288 [Aspergillus germanicus]